LVSLGRILLVAALAAAPAAAKSASQLARDARKAASRGDFARSYLLYSQAVALEPENAALWAESQSVRGRAAAGLKPALAAAPAPAPASAEDPILAEITRADLEEVARLQPPPQLKPNSRRQDWALRAEPRQLFEQVAAAYGLKVIFDADYPPQARAADYHLSGAGWVEALRALENLTGSFVIPVHETLILVARDTIQKRNEVEPNVSMVVPFAEPITAQEVQEGARAVQSMFDMQKVAIDNVRRLVLFRDRYSRVKPAVELMAQLMRYRAEVVIEVELLAVARSSTLDYGLKLPTSFPLAWVGWLWGNLASYPSGFLGFLGFGGGKTKLAVGVADAQVYASLAQSNGTLLSRTELRGMNAQPATVHVGDRYPIQTQGYFGPVQGQGEVFRPPPTVNFEDLGVVAKVTPYVHDGAEVTLDLEAEFKVLSGQSLNGIPVISNRKFVNRVRLRFGETAVVAGLVNEQIFQSWSGLAPLRPLKFLGQNSRGRESTEVLLGVRPRLIGTPPTEEPVPLFWVGTESRPLTPLN
jgi:hypothetical protein